MIAISIEQLQIYWSIQLIFLCVHFKVTFFDTSGSLQASNTVQFEVSMRVCVQCSWYAQLLPFLLTNRKQKCKRFFVMWKRYKDNRIESHNFEQNDILNTGKLFEDPLFECFTFVIEICLHKMFDLCVRGKEKCLSSINHRRPPGSSILGCVQFN